MIQIKQGAICKIEIIIINSATQSEEMSGNEGM